MAVEFDVKGTRTSEYLFAPEQIDLSNSVHSRNPPDSIGKASNKTSSPASCKSF